MTDKKSVVDVLKNTSKGKLSYSSNLIPLTKLSCPIIKNIQIGKEPTISGKQFENYYSPERNENIENNLKNDQLFKEQGSKSRNLVITQNDVLQKNRNEQKGNNDLVFKEKDSNSRSLIITQNNVRQNDEKLVSKSKFILVKKLEQEYRDCLVKKELQRVEKMKFAINEIDQEFDFTIENIEKNVMVKLNNESISLSSQENEISQLSSCEIRNFQRVKMLRNEDVQKKKIEAEEEKKKIQQAIKQKEETKERIRENKLKLSGFLEPAQMIKKQIISLFQECKEKGNLPQSVKILFSQVSTCFNQLSQTVNIAMNCDKEDLSDEIKQVSGLLDSLQKLFEACEKEKEIIKLNDINEKEKNIEKDLPITSANNVNISTTQSLNDLQHSVVQSVANTFAITVTSTSEYTVPNNDNMNFDFPPQLENIKTLLLQNINHYTDTLAFKGYLQLYHLQSQLEKQYEALDKPTTQEKKNYKFNLYKVINTTVNAISDESSKHLLAKFLKLFDLLTEQNIEVGNKIVNIKTDPHALYLCKDLLAKKLVLQGATQIASNYQTAFPIAAIAVCVWTLFPDCGKLILAHFYRSCPYLVPFYIPYSKNIDNCEYYKLLGYDIDDGKIEDEDKYLKKVSGVVRLYAAIIQTDVPPHLGDRPHPHGLEYAWIWLTRFLTLEPRPSISAVIIYDFLEVAGHAMMKRFGKQFQKLLLILYNSYLPKVIEVTTNEGTPMVSRLKMFLDDCVKEGRIKEPEGFLPKQWWNRN